MTHPATPLELAAARLAEMVERAVFAFGNQVADRKLTWDEYKVDQKRWPTDHAKMSAQMRAALSAALTGEVG